MKKLLALFAALVLIASCSSGEQEEPTPKFTQTQREEVPVEVTNEPTEEPTSTSELGLEEIADCMELLAKPGMEEKYADEFNGLTTEEEVSKKLEEICLEIL